jgi:hypothetical protein
MVSPVGKSSFEEEEERSKPKEREVELIPSQSMPLKEVTIKIASRDQSNTARTCGSSR